MHRAPAIVVCLTCAWGGFAHGHAGEAAPPAAAARPTAARPTAAEADIVSLASRYLAAAPPQRVELEKALRDYSGPVEPVLGRLVELEPRRWEKKTGAIPAEHFAAPGLCDTYRDDLLYFYVPEQYDPALPMGLFIFMHGGGGGSPREAAGGAIQAPGPSGGGYRLVPTVVRAPVILVAPSAPWNPKSHARWNLPEADAYIAAVIRECRWRFHIDPDRVFLGGVSMGGFGAYHLCQRLADRIAGGVPCAGSWNQSSWRCMIGTPLFIIHGAADAVAPDTPGEKARPRFTDVFYARAADRLLTEAGAEHVYAEFQGGHWPMGKKDAQTEELDKALVRLVAWMQPLRRDPFYPRVVALSPRGTSGADDRPAPHHRWVSILEVGPGTIPLDAAVRTGPGPKWGESLEDFKRQGFEPAKRPVRAGMVDARYQGNNVFQVGTENVRKFSLWLHPRMVDFAKPVAVVVDGKKRSYEVKPSLLDALRSYLRREDWGLIYHAELAVDVGAN